MNDIVVVPPPPILTAEQSLSQYDFLDGLIAREDIFKCSPEYGPLSKYNNTDTKTVRFILDEKRVGFPGAGSFTFARSEQPWLTSESLKLRLFNLWATPLLTTPERYWRGYAFLTIDWFVNTANRSGVRFELSDSEIISPATKYGLKVLDKAQTFLQRKPMGKP